MKFYYESPNVKGHAYQVEIGPKLSENTCMLKMWQRRIGKAYLSFLSWKKMVYEKFKIFIFQLWDNLHNAYQVEIGPELLEEMLKMWQIRIGKAHLNILS